METILIKGIIGEDYYLKDLRNAVQRLSKVDKIIIAIDSPGGDVDEGFDIRNYLINLAKKTNLEIHVVGECYSIATIIALSTENRFISPAGRFMTHLPFFDEFYCSGEKCNVDYFETTTKLLKIATDKISKVYEQTFAMKKEDVKEWLRNSIVYSATEAIQKKFFKDFSNLSITLKNVNNNKPILNLKMEKKETFIGTIFKRMFNKIKAEGEVKEDEPKAEGDTKEDDKEMKNLDTTLADGTAVRIGTESEELVGATIVVIESGEALPDGTYTLGDGKEIMVEAGIITMISDETEEEVLEVIVEDLTNAVENEMQDEELTNEVKNLILETAKDIYAKSKNANDAQKTERIYLAKKVSLKETIKNLTNKGTGKAHAGTTKNMKQDKNNVFLMAGIQALQRQATSETLEKFGIKNAVIDPNISYTYNGLELLRDTFYKPTLDTPELSALVGKVMYGVKSKQQLFIVNSLNKIVKKYAGNCSVTESGSPATFVENTLETTQLSVNLSQCADDFDNMILETVLNSDLQKADLTGTFVKGIMEKVIIDALRRDFFRILSFGNSADLDADYNQLDGMWTQFLAGGSGVTNVNNAITALNQTAGTTAIDYLLALKEGASAVLDQVPTSEKAFYVTRNVYDNMYRALTNKNVSEAYRALLNGETISLDGIPVIPIRAWTQDLADTANPLNGVKNVLMLYTTKNNHVIGVDGQIGNSGQNLEMFYDRKDRKNYIYGRFTLGYRFVFGELVAISTGLV